jgi:hypothetical protein
MCSESLQVFAAAIKQLAHWALVLLHKDFIQSEAAYAFVDGVKDRIRKSAVS